MLLLLSICVSVVFQTLRSCVFSLQYVSNGDIVPKIYKIWLHKCSFYLLLVRLDVYLTYKPVILTHIGHEYTKTKHVSNKQKLCMYPCVEFNKTLKDLDSDVVK